MAKEKGMRHSGKDTVFRDMFSKKKYLIQMYKALHPEDSTITKADLKIITLQSILLNGIYNDLGFMVRGKQLMILVEAQSTWSPNIVIRALIYLMSTYQDYFSENKIQLYGSKKVEMPKPELYVIYTGDQGSHPDVLSMKDEFFPHADCCIEAKVKIIYLRDSDDIISQYIGFCRVFNEQEQVWNVERENIWSEAFSEGVNRGISQGINQGKLSMLIELVRDGSLSLPAAAKKANLDVAMFKAKMAAAL